MDNHSITKDHHLTKKQIYCKEPDVQSPMVGSDDTNMEWLPPGF